MGEEKVLLVFCTCPDENSGRELAGGLVDQRLAACVNLLPEIQSVYRWQGEVERDSEVLLIIKSTERRWQAMQDFILSRHPYDTPELIALSPQQISRGYKNWVIASCAV